MKKDRRLKVLFIPAWYPNENNPAKGIFIKEHAKAVSLYNDVIVIYSQEEMKNDFRVFFMFTSDKIEDGIRTIRLKHKKLSFPIISYVFYSLSILTSFRKLLKEGWKPDIIHAHVYTSGVAGLMLSKLYRIPLIITEHYTNFANHSLTFFQQLIAKLTINKAYFVLPVSKDLQNSIENYYRIRARFEIVPNVVNMNLFYLSNAQNKIKNSSIKRILSVCILTPRKGIYYLLNSLSQLIVKRQDFVLDIVGDGPNRKEYEKLAKDLRLDEIIKFHGFQSDITSYMKNCDFFVLPSLYENFGVVYIEAMACGKPVIGTNAGGPKEIINKESGILVPPKDIDSLAKAIDYMLDHYQDYSPEKISQYVKDNFSYEIVGKKLNDIYMETLNNAQRRSSK